MKAMECIIRQINGNSFDNTYWLRNNCTHIIVVYIKFNFFTLPSPWISWLVFLGLLLSCNVMFTFCTRSIWKYLEDMLFPFSESLLPFIHNWTWVSFLVIMLMAPIEKSVSSYRVVSSAEVCAIKIERGLYDSLIWITKSNRPRYCFEGNRFELLLQRTFFISIDKF